MSALPAAAWYPDPNDPAQWRWWDGSQWTEHVAAVVPVAKQRPVVAEAAAAVEAPGVQRWAVPALDAPLFQRMDYGKSVHPAFVQAHRLARARRLPELLLFNALGCVVMVLGVAMLRVTRSVLALGMNICSNAVWRVRDDARDEPWAETFRRRGLTTGQPSQWIMFESLCLAALNRGARLHARWSACGDVRGMPATLGELTATWVDDDGRESRRTLLFAAFEIPPLAAARHRRTTVRQRSGLRLPVPELFRDGQQVQLESVAVAKALDIEVDRAADPVAVRELFGPQLVAALAERPVSWVQRGTSLFVFERCPREPAVELDAFMSSAAAVARGYWTDQD